MTADLDDDPADHFVARRPVAAAGIPGLSIAAAMAVVVFSSGGPIGPASPLWPTELVILGFGPVLAFVVVGIVLSAEKRALLWIVGTCGALLFGAAGTVGLAAFYGVDLGHAGGPWWAGAALLVTELSLAVGALLAVVLAGLGWCAWLTRRPVD